MSKSKYRKLILIGNGFDRWQGIPTSYDSFRLYYQEHFISVAEELGFKVYPIIDAEGNEKKITAVEIVYADPFNPDHLASEFFWNLEARMDRLDDQLINLFFGRSEEGLKALNNAVDEAVQLLKRLFCDWVAAFEIDEKDSGYRFTDDCFVINFNYTDTVEKRFGLSKDNVYHIHGTAEAPDSIVVGHSTHPEEPLAELRDRHFIQPLQPEKGLPRLDGLYAVEEALYKTDKHTLDRIDQLCVAMMERGVHIEDFEDVYVLGHSFADADMEYFKFIDAVTRCGCDYDAIAPAAQVDSELIALMAADEELGSNFLFEMIILNIEYATHHRTRVVEDAQDMFPELQELDKMMGGQREYRSDKAEYAVKQRFWYEQAKRTQQTLNDLSKKYCVAVPEGCRSILGYMDYVNYGHDPRKKNAVWHISYHSHNDKKRIEKVMRDLHIKNRRYQLFDSIDQCIHDFKR